MKLSNGQINSVLLVLALGVVFGFYFALKMSKLHDTAALYIGLPIVLATVVALIDTKTPFATTMKVMTIAIVLSPMLVGEGFICVLMASPIFYGVAALVGGLLEMVIDKKKKDDDTFMAYTGLLLVFLLALEGVTPWTTVNRFNEITVEKTVPLSVAQVKKSLTGPTKFDDRPSSFYTWLFLPPDKVTGRGLKVGDRRTITLTYNKWIITNAWTGNEVFEVVKTGKDFVTFRLVEDKSYMDLYLQWHEATATWQRVDDTHTKVKITVSYSRKLDPSWYFGPMERAAVRDAADTMIGSL